MSHPEQGDSAAALRAAVAAVDAAHGDSNDAELDTLRHALALALTRWPEVRDACHPVDRPAGSADSDEPAAGGSPGQPTAVNAEPPTPAELVILPHTGIRVPDPAVRVSSLRQLPTPDGVAYTATLRLGRTPVGTIHNAGRAVPPATARYPGHR